MAKWTKDIPSEDDEEGAFTDWLELQGYTHWHVPQETYTTSWAVKNKAKKLGVRRGVPDHWAIVPTSNTFRLVAIEMKRAKGGTISDDQFERAQKALNDKFYNGKDRANSQLYKQAGNSIVTDVLFYIFYELYQAMPYLFDDLKVSSYFSGIGAFEVALDRLFDTINGSNQSNTVPAAFGGEIQ